MADWTTPCDACPRRYKAIGGSGPQPAPVLAILERPGQDENRYGRVACGKTGQEFDELYLPLAGLDRSSIRVCNTVLCWADSNKTPTDKEITQCAPHHLKEEIRKTKPEVVLLLGSTACSLCPGIKLELHHGIPQPTSKVGDLFGWEGWVVPLHHPAIGLHESRWMTICLEDWVNVGQFLNFGDDGDPEPEPTDYRYVKGAVAVGDYFQQNFNDDYPPAMDTEQHGGRAWSMQVSCKPRTGILLRADDHEGLDALDFWFNSSFQQWAVTMHHAAHDLEWARKMRVTILRYRDTLQEAFHLGNLPQGLKPLVYRLFRHTMTSYAETVRPASIRALQDWMTEAFLIAQADLSFVERVQLKTKVRETVKKGELESLLTRLLRLTDVKSEYDPWERLDAFWTDPLNEWMLPTIESRIGKYPILGIANCSMDEAVRYAVGDSDWTGRAAVELERRRGESFQIFEGDRD